MKLKMREYFQGHEITGMFVPGQVVEIGDDLGNYLLQHRKAEPTDEALPVVAAPETVSEVVSEVVLDPVVQAEPTDEAPAPKKKAGRK
jgi:hypothetical protein